MRHDIEKAVGAVQHIEAVPKILETLCHLTGMGFAAVARVTDSKWIACDVIDKIDFGLKPGGELELKTTICHQIHGYRQPVVISNVAEDKHYCTHLTPKQYGFQSYISVPIIMGDETFFGTLCAIDPRPAPLDRPEVLETFKLFAELIAAHLNTHDQLNRSEANLAAETEKLRVSEASLLDERAASELREQFIAVLGHDLRNPLASIGGGVELLSRLEQSDRGRKVLLMMTVSVQRMSGLINNVLDFARGRLGGGLTLQHKTALLKPTLMQVIDELRSAYPDRKVQTVLALDEPVYCDHDRLSQLFSNLLGNAITHGAEDRPIRVEATNTEGALTLSVTNAGKPIPPEAMPQLFHPFSRGKVRSSLQGLGLGLYIASEIAKAHGGRIDVHSTEAATTFTLTMAARKGA